MGIAIEVSEIKKSYRGRAVLDGISLNFGPGVTAVLGLNGAGKTTLFSIITGRIKADSGTVRIGGVPPQAAVDNLGVMFEEPVFYPYLSGYENIMYINLYSSRTVGKKRVLELMEHWGVPSDKKVSQFSMGMRKRLSLAIALLKDPDYLVLDEPLNGIDIEGQKLVASLFHHYRQEGKCLVFSTHQMEKLVGLADRVVLLHGGQVKFCGSLSELEKLASFYLLRLDKKVDRSLLQGKGIAAVSEEGPLLEVKVEKETAKALWDRLHQEGVNVLQMEAIVPSLGDIIEGIEKGVE